MNIKISVIIPTYKRPVLLKRCLVALFRQNFLPEEYEIIVVTDGPDEETGLMILNLSKTEPFKNISYFSLLCKRGPAAARNAGWKAARGKLILFTDDDCIPANDWVKNYYNAYTFYDSSVLAFTGKIVVPVKAKPTDFELNTTRLETAEFVTANCACSKQALKYLNGFDEAFKMAWREDSDLEFRLIKARIPILKISEAQIVHPVRKAPWGVSIKEQKKSMFNALLFKKHPELYRKKIRSHFLWNYLFIAIFGLGFYIASYTQYRYTALILFLGYFILTGWFVMKRLSKTRRSLNHIVEMVVTSILIPFVSLFWNFYGAIKYKALPL